MRPILIKNGRLIDPAQNLDSNKDLLIEYGIILAWQQTLQMKVIKRIGEYIYNIL